MKDAPSSSIHEDSPLVIQEVLRGEAKSFAQAARLFPPARGGRPCAPTTLWRWTQTGVRGPNGETVKLEAARIGCRWVTSSGALERFLRALNGAPTDQQPTPTPSKPTKQRQAARQKQVEQAQTELANLGI